MHTEVEGYEDVDSRSFFFSSRRRHTRFDCDWSSDVCSSDLMTDPLTVLQRGASAFLDACLEPAVQRIVLLEGPAVLGWEAWCEIDMAYGLGMVTAVLEVAMQTGAIRKAPVEPLAHILLAGLNEGAMLM